MKNLSRRNFIKTTGTATAGIAILPNLLSASPNSTVNVAVIGVGGRGTNNWTQIQGLYPISKEDKTKLRKPHKHVNIVALCDVDDFALDKAYSLLPKAKKFKDFRVMLDKMHTQIDAVIVSTPDHTHFAATMAAMEMGKHVYVEKPLAHNIWQLRTLKKAEKHYGVIAQMGNQGHASDGIRNVKEWYDQGYLGEVKEVLAWFNGPRFECGTKGWFCKPDSFPPAAQPIPENMDWDLWLGPAKDRPHNTQYTRRFWRSYYELGNGMLGDWGCHTLDAPFWALNLGMPTTVEPLHAKLSQAPNSFLSDESILRYQFPERENKPPVTLTWHEGGKKPEIRPEWGMEKLGGNGMLMIGEKATVMTGGRPNDARILMPKEDWQAFNKKGWEKTIPRIPRESPHDEFIAAIRGKGPKPGSNFAYGADLTEMSLLGVFAQRFNTKIEYDAATMKVTNQPGLQAYIKEEVRDGWAYGENLWK